MSGALPLSAPINAARRKDWAIAFLPTSTPFLELARPRILLLTGFAVSAVTAI
jgi:hypothetical protein